MSDQKDALFEALDAAKDEYQAAMEKQSQAVDVMTRAALNLLPLVADSEKDQRRLIGTLPAGSAIQSVVLQACKANT